MHYSSRQRRLHDSSTEKRVLFCFRSYVQVQRCCIRWRRGIRSNNKKHDEDRKTWRLQQFVTTTANLISTTTNANYDKEGDKCQDNNDINNNVTTTITLLTAATITLQRQQDRKEEGELAIGDDDDDKDEKDDDGNNNKDDDNQEPTDHKGRCSLTVPPSILSLSQTRYLTN